MPKLYEKPKDPKAALSELLKDAQIKEEDMKRMSDSLDKRVAENNLPTFAEIQNLALRATAKTEMSKGKEEFLKQTQADIKKFGEDHYITHNRQGEVTEYTKAAALSTAEKSVINAITTRKVSEIFQGEISNHISAKTAEKKDLKGIPTEIAGVETVDTPEKTTEKSAPEGPEL
jgi:hypothetical protein